MASKSVQAAPHGPKYHVSYRGSYRGMDAGVGAAEILRHLRYVSILCFKLCMSAFSASTRCSLFFSPLYDMIESSVNPRTRLMALMIRISPLARPTLGIIISMLNFLYCCTSSTSLGSRSCTSFGAPVVGVPELGASVGAGVALDLLGVGPDARGAASGEDTATVEAAELVGAPTVTLAAAVAMVVVAADELPAGVGVDDPA